MNKTLIAAAAATSIAGAAQSQVVLSGIADAGLRWVNSEGRGTTRSVVSGANSTSRVIFRGTEDLGGGLSAGFHLEHGIALDTGMQASATQFFDRRSTVSLASRQWGELRIGRDFVPSYVGWSRYDPFSYVGAAGSNNLISATPNGPIRAAFGTAPNTTVRSNNSVQWLLPSGWGGLEGGVMLAFRENGTAADGAAKVSGVRLGYAQKSFVVSAAHTRSENTITLAPATAGVFKDTSIGGQWNGDAVRLSLAWRRFEQAAARQSNTLVGVAVPIGLWELKASYNRADLAGRAGTTPIDANDARQLGLGAVYLMSKRSAVYAHASRVDNRGAATYAVPGGAAPAGGTRSTGVEFGLRHVF